MTALWNNIDKYVKHLHLFFVIVFGVTLVITISAFIWSSVKRTNETKSIPNGVTRNTVSKEYQLKQSGDNDVNHKTINWSELTAAIISIFAFSKTIVDKATNTRNDKHHMQINLRLDNIDYVLKDVKEDKCKQTVHNELLDIERDALNYVEDQNTRMFIEGICTRSRNFFNDTVTHSFTEENWKLACIKIDTRSIESRMQIEDIGFSDEYLQLIDVMRVKNTEILKKDLEQLYLDKIYNDKFVRFKEIITKFLKNYLIDIVKIYFISNKTLQQ